MEKWLQIARECGFDEVYPLDPSTLQTETWVRDTCAEDKCHAFGHNWTCPPACGTLEQCAEQMKGYEHGLLLQCVGHQQAAIDMACYAETGERLKNALIAFSEKIRAEHPDALCLGAGACTVCSECAYPEPCRFPDKALSSMEAYGLFVTRVCKDNDAKYHYGPNTIAYTACVLF